MTKNFEASGKTVEEAIDNALALANAAIEDVDIEVLELGGRGMFGLGKKDARVRVSLETPEVKPAPEAKGPLTKEPLAKEPLAKEQPAREKARKPQPPQAAAPAEADEAPRITEMIRQRQPEARAESAPIKGRRRGKDTAAAVQPPAAAPEAPRENKAAPASKAETAALVSAARAFLDPIFASLDVQPQQEILIKDSVLWLVFSGPGLGALIGRRGEMLNALQYLTNLAVNRISKEHARLVLDVEGYRAGREEALTALAKKMAEKAVRSGRRVELEPMNPHERRIVHIALQNDKRVDTASHGEEPYRRVVISRRRFEGGGKGEYGREQQQKRRGSQQRPFDKKIQ